MYKLCIMKVIIHPASRRPRCQRPWSCGGIGSRWGTKIIIIIISLIIMIIIVIIVIIIIIMIILMIVMIIMIIRILLIILQLLLISVKHRLLKTQIQGTRWFVYFVPVLCSDHDSLVQSVGRFLGSLFPGSLFSSHICFLFRQFDDRMSKSPPGAGCTGISAQNSVTTEQRWEQLPSHLANTKAQRAGDPPESW